MYVKTISLKNILSFGPNEQRLSDLKKFNLLIGKNGAGKSNVLRILGALKVNMLSEISSVIPVAIYGENQQSISHAFKLDKSFFNDRNNNKIGQGCELRITYETEKKRDDNVTQDDIVFKNGLLIQGMVNDLEKYISLIDTNWDNVLFLNSLEPEIRDPITGIPGQILLNFGLRYVFEREYRVLDSGELAEPTLKLSTGLRGGVLGKGFVESRWPSGVLQVAKIIQQLNDVYHTKSIFLLEEPELHLEPRSIRRLMDLLSWLSSRGGALNASISNVQKTWAEYHTTLKSTNPRSNKPLPNAEAFKPSIRQIFIASHSPVLINEFLKMEDAAIFEVDSYWMDHNVGVNLLGPNGTARQDQDREYERTVLSQQTIIRRISSHVHSALDSLGASGSDLLQCNGVVWVEGPSDIVYLEKWLEMYSCENNLPLFRRGRNYEFQMYGGSLLDSLCLVKEDLSSSESENQKLVEMLSFSRNAFIVIDSDAVKTADGTVIDKSSFFKAKKYVKEQVNLLNEVGFNIGLWYAMGNTSIRTIEDYLDQDTLELVSGSMAKNQKKRSAQMRVQHWSNKKLKAFPNNLAAEVQNLHVAISKWQH